MRWFDSDDEEWEEFKHSCGLLCAVCICLPCIWTHEAIENRREARKARKENAERLEAQLHQTAQRVRQRDLNEVQASSAAARTQQRRGAETTHNIQRPASLASARPSRGLGPARLPLQGQATEHTGRRDENGGGVNANQDNPLLQTLAVLDAGGCDTLARALREASALGPLRASCRAARAYTDVCWRRLLDNPAQLGCAGLDALFTTLRAQGSLGALRLASRATRDFVDANTSRLSLKLQGHRPLQPGGWAVLLGRCGGVSELSVRADPSGFCKQREAARREPACLLGAAFGSFPTPATARVRSLEVDVHRGRYIESGGGGSSWASAAAARDDVADADGADEQLFESASSSEAELAVGGPAGAIAAAIAAEAAVAVAHPNPPAAAAAAGAVTSRTASYLRYTSLLAFPNLTRVALCGEWACPPQEADARAACAVLAALPHLRALHLGRFTAAGLQQLTRAASGSSGVCRGDNGLGGRGSGVGVSAATTATSAAGVAGSCCQQLVELTLGEAEAADDRTTAGVASVASGRGNAMDDTLTEAAAAALAALGRLERLRLYGVAPGGPAMRALLAHGLAPNLQRLELCRTVAAGAGGGSCGRGVGAALGSASGCNGSGRGSANAAERLAAGGIGAGTGTDVVGAGGVAGCWFALQSVAAVAAAAAAAAAPQRQTGAANPATVTTAAAAIPHTSSSSPALRHCDIELDCSLTDAGAAACCVSYGGLVVRHLRAVRVTVEAGAPPPLAASSQPYGELRQLGGSTRTCVVDFVELRMTEPQQHQPSNRMSGARREGDPLVSTEAASAHDAATAEAIHQVAALLAPPRGLRISAPDVLSPGVILGPVLALDKGLAGAIREIVIWDAPALTPKMVSQLLAALGGLETVVVGRGCRQLWHNSHCYELVAMLVSELVLKRGTNATALAADGSSGSSVEGAWVAGARPRHQWARVVLTAPQISAARVAELNERLAVMNIAVRLATRHA